MVLNVVGKDLVDALNALSGAKQVVNFSVNGNKLILQVFEPVIVEEFIDITGIVKADNNTSISVELNASYNIISETDVVEVSICTDELVLETQYFHSQYASVPVKRVELGKREGATKTVRVSRSSFENIVKVEMPMLAIAKSLHVNEPAVVVRNGYAYIILSNIACRISVDLPDCVLSLKIVRALNDILRRHYLDSVNIELEQETGNFGLIYVKGVVAVAFTLKTDNSMMPATIDNFISGCNSVFKLTFDTIYNGAKVIQSTFKQIEATLVLNEVSPYMVVQQGATNRITIGRAREVSDNTIMLRTNIVTVSAITKIFYKETVNICIGGGYLCCRNSILSLLMSGIC